MLQCRTQRCELTHLCSSILCSSVYTMDAGLFFEKGERVVQSGVLADHFYVVASGKFRVTAPEVNRGRSILATYVAGGVIAERVL